jgi:hypothetical protein
LYKKYFMPATLAKKTMPSFDDLDANYPFISDPQLVISEINPAYCDNPDYQNTCAMRVSKALNYAPGHELPKTPNLYTIKGTDGKRYAIRVREMKKYLEATYGAPTVLLATSEGKIDSSKIAGKKGIIAFDVQGWEDASGHFTLWDGEKLVYAGGHDYFNLYEKQADGDVTRVTKCYFWPCVNC